MSLINFMLRDHFTFINSKYLIKKNNYIVIHIREFDSKHINYSKINHINLDIIRFDSF
jgi:hypothetical protein